MGVAIHSRKPNGCSRFKLVAKPFVEKATINTATLDQSPNKLELNDNFIGG